MIKTERLTIKVARSQKSALEQMARAEGESIAVVVRRLIRTEATRRGLLGVTEEQRHGDQPNQPQHITRPREPE